MIGSWWPATVTQQQKDKYDIAIALVFMGLVSPSNR